MKLFSDLYLLQFLDILVKLFFPCIVTCLLIPGLRACNNNIVSNLSRIAVTMCSILLASFEGAIRFRANSMHETRRTTRPSCKEPGRRLRAPLPDVWMYAPANFPAKTPWKRSCAEVNTRTYTRTSNVRRTKARQFRATASVKRSG